MPLQIDLLFYLVRVSGDGFSSWVPSFSHFSVFFSAIYSRHKYVRAFLNAESESAFSSASKTRWDGCRDIFCYCLFRGWPCLDTWFFNFFCSFCQIRVLRVIYLAELVSALHFALNYAVILSVKYLVTKWESGRAEIIKGIFFS
jgi:hypothetical protein